MWGCDLQPTPWQIKPGMQQPPPISLLQAVLPAAQSEMPPPQVAPSGQHPTGPRPVSGTSMHASPSLQQLLGKPIEEQLLVPVGQDHWRFSRKARADAARRKRSHACGGLSPGSSCSGPDNKANGGRRGSSEEALAHMRRASSASWALRAAIAACGLCGVAASAACSGKAQYSWWNFAPWSGGIMRTATGRLWSVSAWACAFSRASIWAVRSSHSEGGSGRMLLGWWECGRDRGLELSIASSCRCRCRWVVRRRKSKVGHLLTFVAQPTIGWQQAPSRPGAKVGSLPVLQGPSGWANFGLDKANHLTPKRELSTSNSPKAPNNLDFIPKYGEG